MKILNVVLIILILLILISCPQPNSNTAVLETKTVNPATPIELIPEWKLGSIVLFANASKVLGLDEKTCQFVWSFNTLERAYDYKIRQRIKLEDKDYALVTWIDPQLRPWTALIELNVDLAKTRLIYAYPDVVPIDAIPTTDYLFTTKLEFEQLNGLELGTINAVSIVNGAEKSYSDLFMPIAEATPSQPLYYQPTPNEPGNLILIGSVQPSTQTVNAVKKEFTSTGNDKQDNQGQANDDLAFDKLLRSLLPIEELVVASLSTVDAELNYKKTIKLPQQLSNLSVLTLAEKYLIFSGVMNDEIHTALFAIDVTEGTLAWFSQFEETLVVYPVPGDLGYRVPYDYSAGKFLVAWRTQEESFKLTSIELKSGKIVQSREYQPGTKSTGLNSIYSVWYSGNQLNAANSFRGKNRNWIKLDLPLSEIYWDPRYGTINNVPLDLSYKTRFWGKARLVNLGTGKALKIGRHWVDPYDGSELHPDLTQTLPAEFNLKTFLPGSYFVERQVGDNLVIRRYGIPFVNEFAQTDHLFMIYSISNKMLVESDFTNGLHARYLSQYGLVIDSRAISLFDKTGTRVWRSEYSFESGYSLALPKK